MELVKIVYRHIFSHRLRTVLTALAAAIALFGFCMIRTVIDAWYSGVEESSKDRLIVRNAVSLLFPLPFAYGPQIGKVEGVGIWGYGNWFGGEYQDNRYQFGQFAVSDNYFDLLPEFSVSEEAKKEWLSQRQGVLIGGDIARKFNLKPGDLMPMKGTIFPGQWVFKVSGIFTGRKGTGDERQIFFHWDYLNERNRAEIKRNPDHVGFFSVQLVPGSQAAQVSQAIDGLFQNSYAETKTETETEFVKGFISMSSAIISAMNVISAMVLVIMLLVVTNTVLLSFRERKRDYAILKALGFGSKELFGVVLGEALLLCSLGVIIVAVALTAVFSLPKEIVLGPLADFFPVFSLSWKTIFLALTAALLVAIVASIPPLVVVRRERVIQGVREFFS